MPACNMSEQDRALVLDILKEIVDEVPELQTAIDSLSSCQPCPQVSAMKITGTAKPTGDGATAKSGRKLSAYQVFMGECMRPQEKGGRGIPMKNCVDEWNVKKKGGQAVQATEGQVM